MGLFGRVEGGVTARLRTKQAGVTASVRQRTISCFGILDINVDGLRAATPAPLG